MTHTQPLQVSFEAPPGVKRNLQRTYDAWGPDFISQGSPLQAQLLFMLAWFHAIVQERRAYMSQASLLLSPPALMFQQRLQSKTTCPVLLHVCRTTANVLSSAGVLWSGQARQQ